MQLTINEVGTTPVINILAIPSHPTHPNIIPHQFFAVCCVICPLFHEISPHSLDSSRTSRYSFTIVTYSTSQTASSSRSRCRRKTRRVIPYITRGPTPTNMCPVRAAAGIVRRIRNYKDTNNDTPISTVYLRGRRSDVTSKQMTSALQDAIRVIGEDVLNIKTSEIGTHSIRSGGAMAMFIGGCPVFMIMLIGRWSSDAFMKYIRRQIEEFSHDVSQRMIATMFHRYIPAIEM